MFKITLIPSKSGFGTEGNMLTGVQPATIERALEQSKTKGKQQPWILSANNSPS